MNNKSRPQLCEAHPTRKRQVVRLNLIKTGAMTLFLEAIQSTELQGNPRISAALLSQSKTSKSTGSSFKHLWHSNSKLVWQGKHVHSVQGRWATRMVVERAHTVHASIKVVHLCTGLF